ncbi:alpha/beta hydrolase family protein [Streptomyces mobaraensis]|uniref:alpha/beta hydrolase family protein n=1 Tax=Streptomyces mobaraensis TaxID=35621 RepID=UPI003F4CDFD1
MTFPGADDFARPCVSSITSGGHRIVLLTADGVRVEAAHQPGPPPSGKGPRPPAVVLAHGFTGALDRPALRRAAGVFAQYTGVITFSFRGHGRSGGHSTVGDREVLDLAAAVGWARRLGYERVATVGFSMGGSVALRHGGLYLPETGRKHEGRTGAHADMVVSVSAPARWFYRGTAPMRRLHWAVTRPAGRAVARWALRTRVHSGEWDPVPVPPVGAVPSIAPRRLLIVHGDRDPYFPLDHPRALAAAGDPASTELWIEPGFGHAETAAPMPLLRRIARWVAAG